MFAATAAGRLNALSRVTILKQTVFIATAKTSKNSCPFSLLPVLQAMRFKTPGADGAVQPNPVCAD